MAGSNVERRITRTSLTNVDLQRGLVTGATYIETVKGLGKNGLPFRAQPGHMSKAKLNEAGAKPNRQGK